jgi:hypothetical protein
MTRMAKKMLSLFLLSNILIKTFFINIDYLKWKSENNCSATFKDI